MQSSYNYFIFLICQAIFPISTPDKCDIDYKIDLDFGSCFLNKTKNIFLHLIKKLKTKRNKGKNCP